MHDMTQGPIPKHLLRMAIPIAIGMLFQTLYVLIDLYFVARLGDAAIAGVSTAGNLQFIVMGLTQVLGVGTMALIAQAVGRKDRADANLVFNQSLLLSAGCGVAVLVGGYAFAAAFMRKLGADAATTQAGITYLYWFLPALGLQFALISMGSALRGTGIAKPTMLVQVVTVVLNAILAPMLIAGWGTGVAMGVAGAALASSFAIGVGVILMTVYFLRLEHYVGFDASQWRVRLDVWRRILRIGVPPGGEFALVFLYMGVIYWVIRDFGAAAQAGFGIGSRVMQAIFLPVMAIAFAASPVAGQNVGAGHPQRVRDTFKTAALYGGAIMIALTLLCQWQPELLVRGFTHDPAVVAIASEFLGYISWNFLASGLVFTCSGMFQALGNTWPALLSTGTRLVTFALPALWLSTRPGFQLRQLWMLSIATVAFQALLSFILLQREFRRRLPLNTATVAAPQPAD